MGIDLDKVKQKLQNMKNSGNRSGGRIWRPDEGTQKVRMVPYRFNKDYPFIELYFHYDLPGRSHLSPKSFGDDDPIVEFAEELKRKGGKENWKLHKKLMPTLRIYAPIVVRGEEDQGVKFWGFGKTIYEDLLSKLVDPDWGNFFDLQEGRDIKIERIPAEKNDTDYPKTNADLVPNKSPLADSKERMKEIIDTQVEITEVFDVLSYEELENILEDYLNPEDEEEEESVTTSAGKSKKSSVDEVTDEFSDIFDE